MGKRVRRKVMRKQVPAVATAARYDGGVLELIFRMQPNDFARLIDEAIVALAEARGVHPPQR